MLDPRNVLYSYSAWKWSNCCFSGNLGWVVWERVSALTSTLPSGGDFRKSRERDGVCCTPTRDNQRTEGACPSPHHASEYSSKFAVAYRVFSFWFGALCQGTGRVSPRVSCHSLAPTPPIRLCLIVSSARMTPLPQGAWGAHGQVTRSDPVRTSLPFW